MNRENNEDYLDELLNTAISKKDNNDIKIEDEVKTDNMDFNLFDDLDSDNNLFKSLDEELNEGNVEGFLKDFENEIEQDNVGKVSEIEATIDIDMLNNLDNIVHEVSEKNNVTQNDMNVEDETTIDFFHDIGSASYEDNLPTEAVEEILGKNEKDSIINGELKAEELFGTEVEIKQLDDISNDNEEVADEDELEIFKNDAIQEFESSEEEQDVFELLEANSNNEDLADISDLLKKDENNELVEGSDELDTLNAKELNNGSNPDDDNLKNKKEVEKKTGFFSKILAIFNKKEKKTSEEIIEPKNSEDTNENLEILKELEREEKKAPKKKKEKKPKKEKVKKPKKEKVKKPKKEKAEVVYVPSEPLPKVPVVLLIALGISIVVLTMTATKLVGYESYSNSAKEAFDAGNYSLSYEKLQGMDLQENEKQLSEKAQLLSWLEKEKISYDSFVKVNMYAEALDSLAKGVERYRENYKKAESLGIQEHFQKMEDEIESALKDTFAMTPDQAMELRAIKDKIVYTQTINEIVEKQGLAIEEE